MENLLLKNDQVARTCQLKMKAMEFLVCSTSLFWWICLLVRKSQGKRLVMLTIGTITHFWVVPPTGYSAYDRIAAA